MSKFSRNDSSMASEWVTEKFQTFKMTVSVNQYHGVVVRYDFDHENQVGNGATKTMSQQIGKISKSSPLSLNHHTFSDTEPIYTK